MNPHITEITPFTVAGWTIRIKLPNVCRHADIPAFHYTDLYITEDQRQLSGKTYHLKDLFRKSNTIKHCEVYLCYDLYPENGEFDYFYGRGVFHEDDIKKILPDIVTVELSGLYAIFASPLVPVDQSMEQVMKNLWKDILCNWLPNSEFVYDETRKDFEHHDLRGHGLFFGGKKQMYIFVPIRQREEALQEARERGLDFKEVYYT